MNYGTLIDNTLHPAPRAFMLHGAMVTNPKAEHFATWNEIRSQSGLTPYLPVVDERPSQPAPNGYHYEAQGWAELGGVIQRVYAAIQDPVPPPRTFSKLRIVAALTTAGVWESVKQLLIERGFYDLFLAAQNFREDNEYFAQGKSALQSALGWTGEQVEAVLAAAEGGA